MLKPLTITRKGQIKIDMKAITFLLSATLALVALPAFAQHKAIHPTSSGVPVTKAPKPVAAPHISGGVMKPGVANGSFKMGSGAKATKGTWTVDGSKATIVDKKGATVALTDITPGSSVTIEGAMDNKAKTVAATKITVTHLAKLTLKSTTTKPPKKKG
jgi:hypothetical protein